MEFENTKVHGIHKSRYLASYYNGLVRSFQNEKGVRLKAFPYFWEWLEQLSFDDGTKLTDDEIDEIYNFAAMGKMEFEIDMINFLAKRR